MSDHERQAGPVGRVVGTEDATPLTFWVALAPGAVPAARRRRRLRPRRCPDGEPVTLSGVVTQVRARHEGARFDSDVFLIDDGVLPARDERGGRGADDPRRARDVRAAAAGRGGAARRRARSATRRCTSTRWSSSSRSGSAATASRCSPTSSSSTAPAARTSTSRASPASRRRPRTRRFLLYSLFNSGVLGADATNTKALIFNVKGEDLLFLDHANARLDRASTGSATATLGLAPKPFDSVAVYAPPAQGRPERHARRRHPHAPASTPSTGRSPSS